jgi:uncharacterized protein (DUF58 family)
MWEQEKSGSQAEKTLPKEILREIRQIQVRTNRLVNDVMAGEYVSAFKGRGIEFEEVREYQQGDDIRTIDWNVTARMGYPYVKEYREERELTVLILVDVSHSQRFGTHIKMKNRVAAEIAAIMAYAAIKNNDKVGLMIFSQEVERYIPPKKGKGHVWRVIREVLHHKPQHGSTDLGHALEFLSSVAKKRAVVFLISDFLSSGFDKQLKIAQGKHDLIAVTISDPRERDLPRIGFIELEDAETGESILIDTYDSNTLRGFAKLSDNDVRERNTLFTSIDMDHIDVRTDQSYIDPIMKFFRSREKRMR